MGDFKQNIQLIYNALRREGYTDIGSVDDFTKSMQDEGNRKRFSTPCIVVVTRTSARTLMPLAV